MNSGDVPVAAIEPQIFSCQRTLERCLNKIIGDVLQKTTKTKKISAGQWIYRLEEMKEKMYWKDRTNYKINRHIFNIEYIAKNLPLDWKIEFECADISTKLKQNVPNLQPRNYQIFAQLEQIKRFDVMKREIENTRIRNNNNFQRNKNNNSNHRNCHR